ncbi:Rieske 2Fe-2S domain-containing protein [Natronolimnobius sp. AArcel1]|uniref:Rieske (2Fe-2S) protein n=1 Tax=Natronolimnobius sp. AArcel1 TaxID=1679093 RepID=UPI0013EDA7D4|nr:Rieske 2Fe-2S domain-containing protein [Natronolimnobius sp. AArcel1]NGM67724.1 Rieske 2Fe-2S domain-containing protein [Natronolimnobius sp. AArcel1]
MSARMRLTSVETVHEDGSWLFTVRDRHGELEEVLLVPCEDGVEAWINRCTHEAQRLDTGCGAAMRDGQIICPRHGSMFDSCSGYCDNGDAAETTLPDVEIAVDDATVYLTDDDLSYLHDGGIEESDRDDDSGPSSTSHISF